MRLEESVTDASPGEVVDNLTSDPTFNRLTDDVHQAVKQFDAVNKGQKYPNVLAFVN